MQGVVVVARPEGTTDTTVTVANKKYQIIIYCVCIYVLHTIILTAKSNFVRVKGPGVLIYL